MSAASTTVTVRVPLVIRRRGGGKVVITPAGETCGSIPQRARTDPSLVKALARAHRWKRQLEDGLYGSITEMAAAEKIDRGYVGSILRLTLLAPDVIESILDGRQSATLTLPRLLKPFPIAWSEQRQFFC